MERQSLQQLVRTQRLAGIGLLVASVAHELNNPISVITTTCNDLGMQAEDGLLNRQELLRRLEMIEQNAWRCTRLIQTLRTYTHFDPPQVIETTIRQIIEDSLTLISFQFRHHFNITFDLRLAENLPSVLWEPNQVTQVLINLLNNARDVLQPEGGVVRILSWNVPEENGVAFAVHDSGPGIPEELLQTIFDPFFTTKAAGEGTGLGLSIASSIIEQHQGRMWAENHQEGGAIFTAILPCRPQWQQPPAPPVPPAPAKPVSTGQQALLAALQAPAHERVTFQSARD